MAKSGGRLHISLTVSPIRNARGEIIGASKIARDITDRVRAERERAQAQAALSALPPDQRLAVILCDVQDLDYAEIAQVMRVSLGTVKSRINRARSKLRTLLLARTELLPSRFRQSSGEK
jgi:RNA polymerase sigma factor (sigma-70 family)